MEGGREEEEEEGMNGTVVFVLQEFRVWWVLVFLMMNLKKDIQKKSLKPREGAKG